MCRAKLIVNFLWYVNYPLVMTSSLPWKDPPILKNGKPSISLGHLYHGYVSHNQRVTLEIWPTLAARRDTPLDNHLFLWAIEITMAMLVITRWYIYILYKNGPFIVDLPIKNGWIFPWLSKVFPFDDLEISDSTDPCHRRRDRPSASWALVPPVE